MTRREDDLLRQALLDIERAAPVAEPPPPRRRADPRLVWALGGTTAVAAALAIVLAVVSFGDSRGSGDASPTPSASSSLPVSVPSSTSAPELSASPEPTQSTAPPASPTADLAWTETASFGTEEGAAFVRDVVVTDGGLVAAGVQYDSPLPILGSRPAHEGRIWRSTDGSSWADATPAELLVNADVHHLVIGPDGGLFAFGVVTDPADPDGIPRGAVWEADIAFAWQPGDWPFPEAAQLLAIEQGDRGVAAIVADGSDPGVAVWWSADTGSWERVRELGEDVTFDLGAGDEGFVIGGVRGVEEPEPYVIASGDGREWIEAGSAPQEISDIAPRGGDWIAMSRLGPPILSGGTRADASTSANGLDWSHIGGFDLAGIELDGEELEGCTEYPSGLWSAGVWLVAQTTMGYPCSEGAVSTPGANRISIDGATWAVLPFEEATLGESGSGTRISGAVEVDGRLVLVGERNRQATFWLGEAP